MALCYCRGSCRWDMLFGGWAQREGGGEGQAKRRVRRNGELGETASWVKRTASWGVCVSEKGQRYLSFHAC